MKEYDVYLFDFDGTLCDTGESLGPVFMHGFEAIGMSCKKEDALEYMHHSLKETADSRGVSEEQWQPFVDAIVEALDFEDSIKLITLFPETIEVIKELKARGKKLGIVSNNTVNHIKLVLDRFNLNDCFEVYSGSDVVNESKPNAEPILYALRKLGVKVSHNVVYVGDSFQDVTCGNNAHVDAILVKREGTGSEINAIKNLKELLAY